MGNEIFNTSGCKDITTYAAIRSVQYDEKKKLIAELKAYAEKRGYRIVGVVRLEKIE